MLLSIATAAVTAASILSFTTSVNAQSPQYQGCYSSSTPMWTNDTLSYTYQSSGWCRQQCGVLANEPAFALKNGSDCYCGDKLPPESTKVSDDECDVRCQGFGQEVCGGSNVWSVYTTGTDTDVDHASDADASAGVTKGPAKHASQTPTLIQSTVTQAGQTIVVTATSAAQGEDSESQHKSSGVNKGAVAAGVVVGLIVIVGGVVGAFFFVRHRKRREIEEDHQRNTFNRFGASAGTVKSEHSSADSRLDPTFLYRRQSDGSIADERDPSRRVLKVTNPDRNTMVA